MVIDSMGKKFVFTCAKWISFLSSVTFCFGQASQYIKRQLEQYFN